MVRYMHAGRRVRRPAGVRRWAGARPAFARWLGRWPLRRVMRGPVAPRVHRAAPVNPEALAVAELRRAVWPGWAYGEAYVPSWASAGWRVPPVPVDAADVRERMEAALLMLVARSGAEQAGVDAW